MTHVAAGRRQPRSRPCGRRSAASYSGAVQFYFGDRLEQRLPGDASARSPTASFLALPAQPFAEVFRRWYPMAVHLLEGLFIGQRNLAELVGQRERLLALGQADRRAHPRAEQPGGRRGPRRRRRCATGSPACGTSWRCSSEGKLDGEVLRVARPGCRRSSSRASAPRGGALGAGALGPRGRARRLARGPRGRPRPWELAGVFVAGRARAPTTSSGSPTPSRPALLEPALRWLAYTVETETLLAEIADSTSRISTLVDAAKQYSQMDRTPHQPTDLHAGLDATLVMLSAQDRARRHGGQGVRPQPAAVPALRRGAQPGLDQPDRQRPRRHGRGRAR